MGGCDHFFLDFDFDDFSLGDDLCESFLCLDDLGLSREEGLLDAVDPRDDAASEETTVRDEPRDSVGLFWGGGDGGPRLDEA